MKNCIILVGPPCSGKSTIGKELSRLFNYTYISSGDIARRLAEKDGTQDSLNAGNMADEESMRSEMLNVLNIYDNIILDGFPRFQDQLSWLLSQMPHSSYAFIHIDTSMTEIVRRANTRGRSDDIALKKRIEYYVDNTLPMINGIVNKIEVNT